MDLGFTIAIDSEMDEPELVNILASNISGASKERGCVKVANNILKFEKNFDYDKGKVDDTDNGWAYYRFDLDVFPVGESTLEKQRNVADRVLEVMNSIGAKTKLLSEFND